MSSKPNLDDYVDVAQRMTEFFTKHPEGSLQPVDVSEPFKMVNAGDQQFVVYTAAAYRDADDDRPGVGIAWELYPGKTPFTRDSELMNAETSAWGRAILAVGAADSRRGVASREEVRNRSEADTAPSQTQQTTAPAPAASSGDGVSWPFGKEKGKPLSEVSDNSLKWGLDNRFDPHDEKWGEKNQAMRSVIEQELSKRGAFDEIPF